MKKLALIAALILGSVVAAQADTTTSRLGLTQPSIGSTNWGPKINSNYTIIDSSVAVLSSSNTFSNHQFFSSSVTISGLGVFSSSGVTILGTTLANDAATGWVGEYKSSGTSTFVNLASSGTNKDIVQIQLNAGDWDIWGMGECTLNSATMLGYTLLISSVAGNTTIGQDVGLTRAQCTPPNATMSNTCGILPFRVSLGQSTTYYLKADTHHSAGTPQLDASIQARRRR